MNSYILRITPNGPTRAGDIRNPLLKHHPKCGDELQRNQLCISNVIEGTFPSVIIHPAWSRWPFNHCRHWHMLDTRASAPWTAASGLLSSSAPWTATKKFRSYFWQSRKANHTTPHQITCFLFSPPPTPLTSSLTPYLSIFLLSSSLPTVPSQHRSQSPPCFPLRAASSSVMDETFSR